LKRLYLYDDAKARDFQPFGLTRPVSELRAGAELIRLRWERAARAKAYGFIGAEHLRFFDELDAPPAILDEATIPAGSVIVNSRFVVSLDAVIDDMSSAFSCDGRLCAVRVRKSIDMEPFARGEAELESIAEPGRDATPIKGRWLDEVWNLVGDLGKQLSEDIPIIGGQLSGAVIENATVIGKHPIYCETGVGIEPFVVFDANDGPILIRRGATIASFTRIVGPCYIGEHSQIVGDSIRACSIGDVCKVRGEISSTVMLGHSNKGHTGFLGHSYLGRWVNLGAGTTTSDLKNTYGPVHLWTPSGLKDTNLQFLGSFMGDHVKTGIGSLLTTGCVIGAGANIYGSQVSPKYVPPFAWGECEPYDRFESDKFLETVERMMFRRNLSLGAKARMHLLAACETGGAATK
jgi:UDP-N-acetylglucosamine diphosphorylase/glucosamine-1-phosphate N-acetyltransferase